MAVYIYSMDNTVPAVLAVSSLSDYLGDEGLAVVVRLEETDWATALCEFPPVGLGLDMTEDRPELTAEDVVVGPPVEELVAEAAKAGAKYLDVSEGLIQLDFVEDEDVPESPDVESVDVSSPELSPTPLPTIPKKPPVKRAPKKTAAKKAPAKKKPEPVEVATSEVGTESQITGSAELTSSNLDPAEWKDLGTTITTTPTITPSTGAHLTAALQQSVDTEAIYGTLREFDAHLSSEDEAIKSLIRFMIGRMNTDQLWELLDSARTITKG